jgi:Predicted glycosyltransferases
MKLSIVIVNYNVAYFLEHCLLSVRKALVGVEAEVFVVDNNSVDNSLQMLSDKFPEVKVIANKENYGFAKANNQAICISSGEYVLLLNPDTVVAEDTFTKTLFFMDSHPEAGALGVKMINGEGRFLKESKRGFPSLWAAFCKMSGLTALMPHSKKYAQYYMGHLPENQVNQVQVLAGAFMLLRREALDKAGGGLDEDYFMYGEDIDLSYQITLAGYKNYYYPLTSIIHYKGESTKKASLNYVYTFYNAMAIFAKKHLSQKQTKLFSLFIKGAIWSKALLSGLSRLFSSLLLPLIDFVFVYLGYFLLVKWWGVNIWHDNFYYPQQYTLIILPAYIIIWLFTVYISGGYSRPFKLSKTVSGLFFGMITILVFYSLLPDYLRYSRALVLLGAVMALLVMITIRFFYHYIKTHSWSMIERTDKRYIIIGDEKETQRVATLLRQTDAKEEFIGFVSSSEKRITNLNFIGTASQIAEIINIYHISDVVFCAKSLSGQKIMSLMALFKTNKLNFVIAPEQSDFIIGANTINTPSDLYIVSLNSIASADNARKKRILDIVLCAFLLVLSPFIWIASLFTKQTSKYLWRNIFLVLFGAKTWVGYCSKITFNIPLPKIKKGIVSKCDAMTNQQLDQETLQRLDLMYARNYSWQDEINTFFKAFGFIGRK